MVSVDDIRDKFPNKKILRIIGDPTYKAINELREAIYSNAAVIPKPLEGAGVLATLAYSWTQQFMLTLLQQPTQGQRTQAHMHNMGQATQQRHEPTQMQSTRRGG